MAAPVTAYRWTPRTGNSWPQSCEHPASQPLRLGMEDGEPSGGFGWNEIIARHNGLALAANVLPLHTRSEPLTLAHAERLRDRIDAVRDRFGQGAYSWSGFTDPLSRTNIFELRDALTFQPAFWFIVVQEDGADGSALVTAWDPVGNSVPEIVGQDGERIEFPCLESDERLGSVLGGSLSVADVEAEFIPLPEDVGGLLGRSIALHEGRREWGWSNISVTSEYDDVRTPYAEPTTVSETVDLIHGYTAQTDLVCDYLNGSGWYVWSVERASFAAPYMRISPPGGLEGDGGVYPFLHDVVSRWPWSEGPYGEGAREERRLRVPTPWGGLRWPQSDCEGSEVAAIPVDGDDPGLVFTSVVPDLGQITAWLYFLPLLVPAGYVVAPDEGAATFPELTLSGGVRSDSGQALVVASAAFQTVDVSQSVYPAGTPEYRGCGVLAAVGTGADGQAAWDGLARNTGLEDQILGMVQSLDNPGRAVIEVRLRKIEA